MLDILFFNVGHGDSIALKFPDNTWGIVDCNKNENKKEPNVLKFLRKNNIKTLKFICLTHPHKDHFLGLFDVINYCDDVENLILYGLNTGCKEERNKKGTIFKTIINFLKAKNKSPKDIILAKNKHNYSITQDIIFEFLSPSEDIEKTFIVNKLYKDKRSIKNCLSIIIKIVYKNKTVLLCADAQKENWALLEENINADIIKISHHGSFENNKPEYLSKIVNDSSHISIISSDGGKLYKSIPSKRVIDYLESLQNSQILKTYKLPVKENDKKMLSSSLLINAAMDSIGNDITTNEYDGAIKLSIDKKGKISTKIYDAVDEITINS